MMKKVLSLVLTSALVLTSFSAAFADTNAKAGERLSDIAASPNKQAIEVVNGLGIVTGTPEGTFLPVKDVTRAEYAAMITRALGIPKSGLTNGGQKVFKDTVGYDWAEGYLAFCNSKGIMLGDGYGNAMPGKSISTNEAITMALRTVGYLANSSELKGKWPLNYTTKASELGLYTDVKRDAANANRENAAQIIFNVLTVQNVSVAKDGATTVLYNDAAKKEPKTLLNTALNCDTKANQVVDKAALQNTSINLAKDLGKLGTLYVNKNTKKVVAFVPKENSMLLSGRFIKGGAEFITTDGAEYNVNANSKEYTTANLYNGQRNGAKANGEVEIFAEISGKTIKNVFVINNWQVSMAKKATSADLADINANRLAGYYLPLNDSRALDMNKVQLVGITALSQLKADNVLYVYADKAGEITKLEVGTKAAQGVVKTYNDGKVASGIPATFKIGDTLYKNANASFEGVLDFAKISGNAAQISASDLGKDVKVYLDARGFVYDVAKTSNVDSVAVVEKVGGSLDTQAKLMLSNGTEKVLSYDAKGIIAAPGENKLQENTVIGYGLNGEKIGSANLAYAGVNNIKLASKYLINNISVGASTVNGFKIQDGAALGSLHTSAKLADNAVIFAKDGTDYSVVSVDRLKIGENIGGSNDSVILLFGVDNAGNTDMGTVIAMIVPSKDTKGGTEKIAAVNKASVTVDPKDSSKKVQEVELFMDGAKTTKYTEKDNVFGTWESVYNADMAGKSDDVRLFKVTLDGTGVILNAELVNNSFVDVPAKLMGKVGTDSLHEVEFFKAVSSASDRNSLELPDGGRVALSDKAVFLKLGDNNRFGEFIGNVEKGDQVKLYELDGKVGYDAVIVVR